VIEVILSIYGIVTRRLLWLLKDLLAVEIIGEGYWKVLSIGYQQDNRYYWQMRNQVVYALRELSWF
jgi:hypothetical protein